MSLTNLLVPTFTQMLGALSGWLDKARSQLPDAEAEALLKARLAPDMFPLSTQVRFACVQAMEAAHRLRGLDFPPTIAELLAEGRSGEGQPGTLADAQARIAQTIAFLSDLAPDALDVDPDSPIAHALPIGMVFDLTAQQYARDWALGQFYFHVMTAYAILRNAGVSIGKADYIPHMLPYLRQAPDQA
ncbi:hypothetical protein HNO88_001901 [Novosphingobium chloroacetimidivorans]|uniref:DUF1993 domain-containing protein n=1 Tax=Novosphingobium chloroacetimidivorans TaxID=1428314 RepID=A0A7W7NVI8_9SPHN|nr:DUF1993 domain-containing protein [Novosphingobium chloroacetimidivorans]MBB4858578.1 hypothetical protein [Novosphingobium chloroacetimidivorans]